AERAARAVDGLGDWVDGFEFHYPNELNEDNLSKVQRVLGEKDIYCLALGLFSDPRFALGSFINPKKELRREAIEITKSGIDLASHIGARFIIWPGGEGYNYPFQVDYDEVWSYFIDGIGEVVDYAAGKDVTVFLEHKNSEPAMKILMRNMGMSLYVVFKLREKGIDTSKLQMNMDWQHLLMNGEHLAEYAAILGKEGLLGHQHANSGWGTFDDDNMVGASFFTETLALAKELQRVGYGSRGERIGFDLFPYTENQVEAVKQSIIQWEFIDRVASRIDSEALSEAQRNRDAVRAYMEVYKALGMDASLQ
ncbi:MAG: TIM barrel protein, partial [Bacillota bacterium]